MTKSNSLPHSETKDRLLLAALHAFGQRDYDGVSTREIVEEAEANISAISYHFGGKQELYLATVTYLADKLHAGIVDRFSQIEQRVKEATPNECANMLCQFLGHFLEQMLLGEVGMHAPGIIFREQNQPTAAFEILYEKLLEPMHCILASLVARYRGTAPTDQAVIIMTHALLGQTIIFRLGRTTLLRRLNQSAYKPSTIQQFKTQLSSYTLSVLNSTPDNLVTMESTHHA
ncbi:MAG: CerR family C-terminal domain-containing protein [Candidatus Thiodiazotropha sp. (ex Codakia rugifera)]|nr:CerR family C-terminal domain-containing protein [Candidatus Thiodiazotropha sp. (ex Codakia rugifera)]